MLGKFFHSLRALRHYGKFVVLDGHDNSVTVSRALLSSFTDAQRKDGRVFVFRCIGHDGRATYGFTFLSDAPEVEQAKGHFCPLSISPKYNTVGFTSEMPSVNQILYDFGINYDAVCKIGVLRETAGGIPYYELQRPAIRSIINRQ